jgi:hypothetical protein
MPITHNAHQIGLRLHQRAAGLPAAVQGLLDHWAQRVAVRMKEKAPKFQSTLTNSVRVREEGAYTRFIGPLVAYAQWVEKGRRPGKGLPRFFDPAAADAQAWLRAHIADEKRGLNSKWRPGRMGSERRMNEEVELRDRYMAWSRSVKLHGIKAQPFVKPTADEMRPLVVKGLQDGMKTLLAGTGGAA